MNNPFSGERMAPNKINFAEKFSKLPDDDYSVRIIARMNNYEFKIVKFKGDFVWRSHGDTDETFIILKGKMLMHFRDHSVEVSEGEMIVIPRGLEHKPSSENAVSRPRSSSRRAFQIPVISKAKSQFRRLIGYRLTITQ